MRVRRGTCGSGAWVVPSVVGEWSSSLLLSPGQGGAVQPGAPCGQAAPRRGTVGRWWSPAEDPDSAEICSAEILDSDGVAVDHGRDDRAGTHRPVAVIGGTLEDVAGRGSRDCSREGGCCDRLSCHAGHSHTVLRGHAVPSKTW